ncbi:uncharacterized protein LOC141819522, partial [Curcuma longa]|uniref:uncharacterized protein LOC141819522 n=1 Tax=Curcuma longa TaxID=136217 RepID=UPI003D9F021F
RDRWLPSTLASIYDWFTPAVLFFIMNLVISDIVIASKSSSRHHLASALELDGGGATFPGRYLIRFLTRSPSAILDRLLSFNLNRHSVELSHQLEAAAAAAPATNQASHFRSTKEEDGGPLTVGEMSPKLEVRMKKSASEKSTFAHFEREEIEDAQLISCPICSTPNRLRGRPAPLLIDSMLDLLYSGQTPCPTCSTPD